MRTEVLSFTPAKIPIGLSGRNPLSRIETDRYDRDGEAIQATRPRTHARAPGAGRLLGDLPQRLPATGLDAILSKADLTKGAIYYHFENKAQLGHAVFDEVVAPRIREHWLVPLGESEDPLGELIARVRDLSGCPLGGLKLGCPLNNLIQEATGVDRAFRKRMNCLLDEWRSELASNLRRGQRSGTVGARVRSTDAAAFIVASLEGVMGVVKPAPDLKAFKRAIAGFTDYLESLRPS